MTIVVNGKTEQIEARISIYDFLVSKNLDPEKVVVELNLDIINKDKLKDTFLKEHLFADIFARDNLDYQSRELTTIAALASMTGTAGQLQFHLGAAMNTGLSEAQMKDFISVLESKVGKSEAESANEILAEVLSNRAK